MLPYSFASFDVFKHFNEGVLEIKMVQHLVNYGLFCLLACFLLLLFKKGLFKQHPIIFLAIAAVHPLHTALPGQITSALIWIPSLTHSFPRAYLSRPFFANSSLLFGDVPVALLGYPQFQHWVLRAEEIVNAKILCRRSMCANFQQITIWRAERNNAWVCVVPYAQAGQFIFHGK